MLEVLLHFLNLIILCIKFFSKHTLVFPQPFNLLGDSSKKCFVLHHIVLHFHLKSNVVTKSSTFFPQFFKTPIASWRLSAEHAMLG